jgi:MSHA pilin protein MshA
MHKNGFTLIELIVVISILGILSIVALPRFLDASSEALLTKLISLEQLPLKSKVTM